MDSGAHRVRQRLHQGQHGTGVGAEVRLQIEFTARQQNRDAVVADGPGKQDLVAAADRSRRDAQSRDQMADSGSGDVHLIGFAVFDHFGVAARDNDAGGSRGSGHGANFGFQDIRRQAGFEDVTDHQRLRAGSGNCQVIHGSVHGEFADRASGKTQRAARRNCRW